MRKLITVIFLFTALVVNAQTGGRPPVIVKSPEVEQGGKVTFRFLAPNAQQVMLQRDGTTPKAMSKDSSGVWAFTETLEADIYPYTFNVDGNNLPDPNNPALKPIYKMALGQSMVHVPGPASLSWEQGNVPHGAISHHFYKSAVIGSDQDLYVYTPPNYDANRKKPYPVLYLFHGLTDEASAWTAAGKAHVILDNLIAQGKAEPMIMVNTLGYGVPDLLAKGFTGMTAERFKKNNELFVSSLIKEVLPMVGKNYNTGTSQKTRAVAGLSMGGGQALLAGLNNPNLFNYVGAFSPAVPVGADFKAGFPQLNKDINNQLALLWIGIGKDDFLLSQNKQFKQLLETNNIDFDYKETEGAHTWMVWRRYLIEFVPLLFK